MTRDRATQERRDREFAAARTAEDVDVLQRRWRMEDDAHAAAQSWQVQETRELKRRLAAVERALGHGGRRVVDALVGAVGEALRRVREEERQHTADAISKVFEQRCLIDYRGVWSAGQSYVKGSGVTDKGALWIATGPCGIGQRPGTGASCWRLAVKSQAKDREPVLR